MNDEKANRRVARRMAAISALFSNESRAVLTEVYVMDIEEKGLESNILAHVMTLAMFKGQVKNFSWYKKFQFFNRLRKFVKELKRHPKLADIADQIKPVKRNGGRK